MSVGVAVGVVGGATAGSSGWSYSGYPNGSYVPKSGSFSESIFGDQYRSRVDFAFDSHNVTNILDYNNGGTNPGGKCPNLKAYLTLDLTAKPNNPADLEIGAESIATNMPNPKLDIEINGVGVDPDESEVVALGSVKSGTGYYMTTYWDDYRDGGANDGGRIQAQFAMSNQGVWDYNNCTQAYPDVQVINYYSKNYGGV